MKTIFKIYGSEIKINGLTRENENTCLYIDDDGFCVDYDNTTFSFKNGEIDGISYGIDDLDDFLNEIDDYFDGFFVERKGKIIIINSDKNFTNEWWCSDSIADNRAECYLTVIDSSDKFYKSSITKRAKQQH